MDNLAKPTNRALFLVSVAVTGALAGAAVWLFFFAMEHGIDYLWTEIPHALGVASPELASGPFGFLPYPFFICLLGGLLIGLYEKMTGTKTDDLNQVMAKVKQDGRYPYDNLGKLSLAALLPLLFGGSIGPEAGLTGVIAGLCSWVGDRMRRFGAEFRELTLLGTQAALTALFTAPVFGFVAPLAGSADGQGAGDGEDSESGEITIRLPKAQKTVVYGIAIAGGLGTYLSASDLQTARGEPVQDTARVLGRYYDAIVCRTYKQTTLDMLAKYSGIPVVSGMTDYAHPLQVLTDLMTVRERKGTLAGLKAGFVGDGYNMANSVIVGCLAVGMTVTIACPKGYRPAADVLMLAKQYGDKFTLTNDPDEAARDADVLFTDVWVSMGMEREAEQRRRDFTGFTLDAARMALAKPDCMVQHPLPAHRGEEITPDVLEAHADEIFDEAENRIYVEKAALAVLLAGK